MRLSVVIVAYGGDLTPLLDALSGQKAAGDEVIVVDNLPAGSAGIRGHAAVDRLIEPGTNLHYALGVNTGARVATGDAIVTVNPDGSGVRTVYTAPHSSLSGPAWSPDGNRIAFVQYDTAHAWRLYVLELEL